MRKPTNPPRTRTPSCYTHLRPFRGLFAQGLPVLTYHKLGPNPRGVRLGGLYVSEPLFRRQIGELNAAGFGTCDPSLAVENRRNEARRVVVAFDDGFLNVLRHGCSVLAEAGFRAIQFLVADRLGQTNDWEQAEGEVLEQLMDRHAVMAWLDAGHDIGAHTLTHPWLTRIAPERAREEIAGSKKKLEDLFGRPVRHFCYPYGDWNVRIRDLAEQAGYATACTTEFGVNSDLTDAFALKRLTARRQTLRVATLGLWLRWKLGR